MIDDLEAENSNSFAVTWLMCEDVKAGVPARRVDTEGIDIVESLLLKVLRRCRRVGYLDSRDQLQVRAVSWMATKREQAGHVRRWCASSHRLSLKNTKGYRAAHTCSSISEGLPTKSGRMWAKGMVERLRDEVVIFSLRINVAISKSFGNRKSPGGL